MSGVLGGVWEAALKSVVGAGPLEKVGFEQKHEGDEGMRAVVICKQSRYQKLEQRP